MLWCFAFLLYLSEFDLALIWCMWDYHFQLWCCRTNGFSLLVHASRSLSIIYMIVIQTLELRALIFLLSIRTCIFMVCEGQELSKGLVSTIFVLCYRWGAFVWGCRRYRSEWVTGYLWTLSNVGRICWSSNKFTGEDGDLFGFFRFTGTIGTYGTTAH